LEAAIILSTMSLFVSLSSLTWLLAKHFSTHQIQMVPLTQELGLEGAFNPQVKSKSEPYTEMFREFDRPRALDPSEEAYFNQHNKKA